MRKLIWVVLFFLLVAVASAEIKIYNPPDKFMTFGDTLMLQGAFAPGAALLINDISFKADADGAFGCGLVLHRGKNLVSVIGGGEQKNLRLLKMVTFPDVEQAYDGKRHWARGQIIYLATLGIIEGYPDGNFYPGNPVTRGEFATWLAKAKKLPIVSLEGDVFFDVPKEHWRAPYVKTVVATGYMAPQSTEQFGVDEPISRREVADIAVKTEGLDIIAKIKPLFRDVPQEGRGAAPIYTAQESGLVIGVNPDLPVYDPGRAITRAETATLISRFFAAQYGIRFLSDFEQGYSPGQLCGLNVAPQVTSFSLSPDLCQIGKLATLKLRATVAPRGPFVPLAKVTIDLTSVGGLPDAEMFDNGTAGDETAGDLTYSLNLSYQPKEAGDKVFRVTVTDKLGWEGKSTSYLTVVE
ncbi:MAG: S-layer homology domain-containing protein [Candidatus Margulisbacteria bacterium]|jgi:hypothetical protein|nr:S-layer homology domain-containing protein [Candidatus Margulisiibacteriota bacterium]